jgi:succinoglycan biosynthesis protein ExoV
MKLFYWDKAYNFGDQLNPWLFQKLAPHLFDASEEALFVGIGTLINRTYQEFSDPHFAKVRKIVFGSGVGYGQLPHIDETWTFYCVCGPLSAKALGLSPEHGVVDPAVLVSHFFQHDGVRRAHGFMPHWEHDGRTWRTLCEAQGLTYVSACAPVESVMTQIASLEVLYTEAMHGAIVAEALRTPWVASGRQRGCPAVQMAGLVQLDRLNLRADLHSGAL